MSAIKPTTTPAWTPLPSALEVAHPAAPTPVALQQPLAPLQAQRAREADAVPLLARTYNASLSHISDAFADIAPQEPPQTLEQAQAYLRALPPGETPMPFAPKLVVAAHPTVPSQYLLFNQTAQAVQETVAKITYKPNMVVFVGEDEGKPYIQVGIIGPDNYPPKAKDLPDKIVYGRRWRVEQLLPTSEVIQTVFAAIKSAEEHEVREQFVVKGYTPFNNHMDAPLMGTWMAANATSAPAKLNGIDDVISALEQVRIGGCRAVLKEFQARPNGRHVVDVTLDPDESMRTNPDLAGKTLSFVTEGSRRSDLMHGLMDATLHTVNRHIEETFAYDGFARFSRESNDFDDLMQFVAAHRNRRNYDIDPRFPSVASKLNQAIDKTRAPEVGPGPAADVAKAKLAARPPELGVKPVFK